MNTYIVSAYHGRIASYLLENGRALEIHLDDRSQSLAVGNIYVGRVQRVASNIHAAFVETEPGCICYLPMDNLEHTVYVKKGSCPSIQQDDELLVQVSREAIKSKAPALTTTLSLEGRGCILELGANGSGISKKLDAENRSRLKQLCSDFFSTRVQDCSIIMRTAAGDMRNEELTAELSSLYEQLHRLTHLAVHRTARSCLYRQETAWLKRLITLNADETEKIVIEDRLLYEQAADYLNEVKPELCSRLKLYDDTRLPMDKCYLLERELRDALSERVWMKSGAYLVIQATEALTAVDVNTGKCETWKRKNEMIRRVNLEAARETAKQLRLRNISGMILIDFINMEDDDTKKQVLQVLHECLQNDPVKAQVIDITKLNLVEVTRKKIEKPLSEAVRAADQYSPDSTQKKQKKI